jgi:hypothetical protein
MKNEKRVVGYRAHHQKNTSDRLTSKPPDKTFSPSTHPRHMDVLNSAIEGKIVNFLAFTLVPLMLILDQDFKGQHLADQITEISLIIFAIVAFLVGYVTQNILYTVLIMAAGSACTCLVCPLQSFS